MSEPGSPTRNGRHGKEEVSKEDTNLSLNLPMATIQVYAVGFASEVLQVEFITDVSVGLIL